MNGSGIFTGNIVSELNLVKTNATASVLSTQLGYFLLQWAFYEIYFPLNDQQVAFAYYSMSEPDSDRSRQKSNTGACIQFLYSAESTNMKQ